MNQLLEHLFGVSFFADKLNVLLVGLVIVACTFLADYVISRALRHFISKEDVPVASSSIFINVARVFIFVVGASLILDLCFKINVSAIVTALGVGGIAVSLGFQDTISNFFGGLQLSVMRIIIPGDRIKVSGETGVVLDVTWRHTLVRTQSGEKVYIPNSVLSKSAVTLLPEYDPINFSLVVKLSQAYSVSDVKTRLETALAELSKTYGPFLDEPSLSMGDLTDTSVTITVSFDIQNHLSAGEARLAAYDLCWKALHDLDEASAKSAAGEASETQEH